jgi:hypothetical protein
VALLAGSRELELDRGVLLAINADERLAAPRGEVLMLEGYLDLVCAAARPLRGV